MGFRLPYLVKLPYKGVRIWNVYRGERIFWIIRRTGRRRWRSARLRERRVGLSWRRASLAHRGQTCRRSHVEDPETDHPGDGQEFVTLAWAEPLKTRQSCNVQLAVMQAVARLRASGIRCFRVHSDRGEGLSWGVLGKVFGRTRHSPDGPRRFTGGTWAFWARIVGAMRV